MPPSIPPRIVSCCNDSRTGTAMPPRHLSPLRPSAARPGRGAELARPGAPGRPRGHRPVGLPHLLPPARRQGHYDVPDGEEIWKLLLVIALNKVRAAGAVPPRGEARRPADRRRRVVRPGPRGRVGAGRGGPGLLRMVDRRGAREPARAAPADDRAADRGVRGGRDRRDGQPVEAVGGAGPPGLPRTGSDTVDPRG